MSQQSLIRQAYEQILQRILKREYVPGQMLNRRDVASDLGMSMTPVREAMTQLQSEGLLEAVPRRGTLVRTVQIEEVRDQLILRMALECQAARLYCGAPIKNKRKELEQLAQAVDNEPVGSFERMRADIIFHGALIKLAQCPPLLPVFDQVMRHSFFIATNLFLPEEKHIPRQHVKLVKALQVSDPGKAETIMRTHLLTNKESIFNVPTKSRQISAEKLIWPSELGIYERRAIVGD